MVEIVIVTRILWNSYVLNRSITHNYEAVRLTIWPQQRHDSQLMFNANFSAAFHISSVIDAFLRLPSLASRSPPLCAFDDGTLWIGRNRSVGLRCVRIVGSFLVKDIRL